MYGVGKLFQSIYDPLTPPYIDLRKLLGGADGKPPTRETYVSYIQGVSPCALMPHVAEKLAEEVWKNLSESFAAGQAFSPTGRYDIDVVMTIPL